MAGSTPLSIRALDFITEKVPKFVVEHPMLSAGAAGVLYGAHKLNRSAQRMEDTLRAERQGIPGSRYAPEDLNKFSALKELLEVKCAYEKTAGPRGGSTPPTFGGYFTEGISKGFGSGVAETGMRGVLDLLGRGAQSISEKFVQDPKREKILTHVMNNDPMLSSFENTNPGVILKHYQTLVRFAPTLSTDPNVVTSYLRATAPLGGSMDPTVIKGLAEAEQAVLRAKNEGRWNFGGKF